MNAPDEIGVFPAIEKSEGLPLLRMAHRAGLRPSAKVICQVLGNTLSKRSLDTFIPGDAAGKEYRLLP
jgi:hypothetical protein